MMRVTLTPYPSDGITDPDMVVWVDERVNEFVGVQLDISGSFNLFHRLIQESKVRGILDVG